MYQQVWPTQSENVTQKCLITAEQTRLKFPKFYEFVPKDVYFDSPHMWLICPNLLFELSTPSDIWWVKVKLFWYFFVKFGENNRDNKMYQQVWPTQSENVTQKCLITAEQTRLKFPKFYELVPDISTWTTICFAVQNQIVNNLSICLPFAKSNCQPFVLLCKIKLSTICQFACNLSICSLQNQIVNNLSICSLQNQIVNNLSICRLQNQIVNNLSICSLQNQIVNNLSICLPFAKSNCQPFVLLCKIKLSTICQFACNLSICSLQNQIVNNLSICSLQNQIVNNLSICRLQNQIVNNLSICSLQNQIVNNLSICSLQNQIVNNLSICR
eukprot:COSAG01_NODE_12249_length_1773_cov_57.006571_1_plen_327_part_10